MVSPKEASAAFVACGSRPGIDATVASRRWDAAKKVLDQAAERLARDVRDAGAHFEQRPAVGRLTGGYADCDGGGLLFRDRRRFAVTISQWVVHAIVLSFVGLAPLHAAEPASAPAPSQGQLDEEEQVDEGLKRFGYLAGLARGCVVEDQRADLEREALDLHSAIARLLGTDRAFLFSSSFGYGTTVLVETRDCAEVLKNYEARVVKYRASRGEGK